MVYVFKFRYFITFDKGNIVVIYEKDQIERWGDSCLTNLYFYTQFTDIF